MRSSFIKLQSLIFALLVAGSLFTQAAPGVSFLPLIIDGHSYTVDLKVSNHLQQTIQIQQPNNNLTGHYAGKVHGEADSWVRLSQINGRWQGIVSLNGRMHILSTNSPIQISEVGWLQAVPATAFGPLAQCGALEHSEIETVEINLNAPVKSLEANYDEACVTTVDGVCLMAELEIVFDTLFQLTFPTTFAAQATSLVNIVEGYYRNDLNIGFDTITMEFPSTTVFDTTTDASDLLDDIWAKKNGNQLSFVKNRAALLHLVTGRNFDGTTAGVAGLRSLCDTFFNAGTSQLLTGFGGPNIPLTAIVVAHEIGHNFGAEHDTDDNVCTSGFIMAPSVTASATGFSACSVDEMVAQIDTITDINACFNFPIDISIAQRPGNPVAANAGETSNLIYDVVVEQATLSPTLIINGSFTSGAGTFATANANSAPCAIAGNQLTYQCTLENPGVTVTLDVDVVGTTQGQLAVNQVVSFATNPNLVDLDTSNESATSNITINQAIQLSAPTNLTGTGNSATPSVSLNWQDSNTAEEGSRIERSVSGGAFQTTGTVAVNIATFVDNTIVIGTQYTYRIVATASGIADSPASNTFTITVAAPPPAPASSSGGGGGAMDIWMLLLAALLFFGNTKIGAGALPVCFGREKARFNN